ncbi:Melanoma-associated antigen E1 [Ceratobasidium theobromae]|uniref:Melanoma-associated antigen E1 n=1 Tax=Ceratobasidium theobromae TaxID=1582974 RepID=A0A5N5QA11_9AGAM|nr:Melanoma-associated antigen E1 [Ceratobasidium theobromae]
MTATAPAPVPTTAPVPVPVPTTATVTATAPAPAPVPVTVTATAIAAAPAPMATTTKPHPKPVKKPQEPAPPGDGPVPVVPTKAMPLAPTAKLSKCDKKLSAIAQKVQVQEAASLQVKAEKARKKAKKEEAIVIDETPEETEAFIAHMTATQPMPMTSAVVATPAVGKPCHQTGADHRKAMEQLISLHRPSPAPSAISALSLSSSAVSSLAPSESISQAGTPTHNNTQLKAKVHPARQLTLSIPLSPEGSRDVSPAAESILTMDGNDEGPVEMAGFNLNKILGDIPSLFVIKVKMPELLPGPLHTMQRQIEPRAHDYTSLKGAEHQKQKCKYKGLKILALCSCDQTVAKHAIDHMDALLACCCAFPNDKTTWILANMANMYACQKLGRNYVLTQGSEYQKLLYSCISQSRGKFVKLECAEGITSHYQLRIGWDNNTQEFNRNHIHELLTNAAFTALSFEQSTQLYEHPFFKKVLKQACFTKASSKGLIHSDLFQSVTIPLLALSATAVEKMLIAYSTGSYQKSSLSLFLAKTFTLKYYSHLITLSHMYRSNKNVLMNYLNQLTGSLHALHVAASGVPNHIQAPICASVPLLFISQQYATQSLSQISVSSLAPPSLSGALGNQQPASNNLESALISVVTNTQLRATQTYSQLLAEVTGRNLDSEVEAQRAGAIPSARAHAKMAARVWESEEGDDNKGDAEGEEGKEGKEGKGKGEGEDVMG